MLSGRLLYSLNPKRNEMITSGVASATVSSLTLKSEISKRLFWENFLTFPETSLIHRIPSLSPNTRISFLMAMAVMLSGRTDRPAPELCSS